MYVIPSRQARNRSRPGRGPGPPVGMIAIPRCARNDNRARDNSMETLEDLDLRATESVDRLLDVADGEETLASVAQLVDQTHLHVVRVLCLVEHDVLESACVALAHSGIV